MSDRSSPLADITYPVSLETLGAMTWEQFEAVVVALVDAIYGEAIAIKQTPSRSDGGRDGEGTFTLLKAAPPPLGFELIVWVEVKHRTRESIGAAEFGNTTFRASIAPVHKLLLASNRSFAGPYLNQLQVYGQHHRIDVGALDGAMIVDLLNHYRPMSPGHERPPTTAAVAPAAVQVGLVGGRLEQRYLPIDAPEQPRRLSSDSLMFLAVDVSTDQIGRPLAHRVTVTPTESGAGWILPSENTGILIGPGKRRYLTPVMPAGSGEIRPEDIASVTVTPMAEPEAGGGDGGDAAVPVHYADRSVMINDRLLPQVDLAFQKDALERLTRALDALDTAVPGSSGTAYLLKARAGWGKSYVMGELRREVTRRGMTEVWIDGEDVSTPGEIFRAIVRTYFALPEGCFSRRYLTELRQWLKDHAFSAKDADLLVDALDPYTSHAPTETDETLLARIYLDVLVALLARIAQHRRLAIFFEDLHKIPASAIDMLSRLAVRIEGLGAGVFLILSTRPLEEHAKEEAGALSGQERVAQLEGCRAIQVLTIQPRNEREARAAGLRLVRAALPALPRVAETSANRESDIASRIVSQVGAEPYAIGEAMRFLHAHHVVSPSAGGGGTYEITDHGGFLFRITPDQLVHVSEKRLRIFLNEAADRGAVWLKSFLIAAALLGRGFDQRLCSRAAGLGNDARVPDDDLNRLVYWDILRLGRGTRLEFRHDLLRDAMLTLAAREEEVTARRTVAPDLYAAVATSPDMLREQGPDRDYLMACLALVADDELAALALADAAATGFRARRRHLDSAVAELLWFEVSTPDLCPTLLGEASGPLGRLLARNPVLTHFPPLSHGFLPDNQEVLARLIRVASGFLEAGLGEDAGLGGVCHEISLRAKFAGPEGAAITAYLHGRLAFAKDRFADGARHHQAALDALADMPDDQNDDMAETLQIQRDENLDRLFLCQRQLGHVQEARETLRRRALYWGAGALAEPSRRSTLANRLGYLRLYVNPGVTSRLWHRQLHLARRMRHQQTNSSQRETDEAEERVASGLIGTAIMRFALDDANGMDEAERRLIEAADILDRVQRRNLMMRVGMLRANLAAVRGEVDLALSYVHEAETLAASFGNARRLWRVQAVRAVVEEAASAADGSDRRDVIRQLDERVMGAINSRLGTEHADQPDDPPWLWQRHALGAMNIALRHPALVEDCAVMSETVKRRLLSMAEGLRKEDLSSVPGHLRIFIKPVPRLGMRAMVTE